MTNLTCKDCGQTFNNPYYLAKHRKQSHPDKIKKYPSRSLSTSPQQRILQAEQSIQDALRDIDIEQHKLQEQILALDQIRAKYKKL